MACGTCSKKNKKAKSFNDRLVNTINPEKTVIFDSILGKILYFSLCLVICLTPILNVVCLYIFFKTIFGRKKIEITEEDGKINKDKNIS